MRNLEDLIRDTSGTGLSQALIVGFVALTRMSAGWCMMSLAFANFVPKWCCLPDNLTVTHDQYCNQDVDLYGSTFAKTCEINATTCSRRVFLSSVRSVVFEWNLVCERKWMVPLTTSIQMAGLLFGGLLSGQMADLIGRKKTVYFFTAFCVISNFIAAFSTSWEMFASACFLVGAAIGGYLASAVPYTTEFILPSRRACVTILPTFHIGICLMALTAWRVQNWRTLYWICGVVTIPQLLPFFFLPESLRWLTVKGRVDDAQRVVEWIARWNKQEVPQDSVDIIKAVAAGVQNTEKNTSYTYIHVYKGWHLFKSSVILQFLWFTVTMCAYGFSFGASAFGSNMYLNLFLLSIITLPGVTIVSLVIGRLGRKKTAMLFLVLASACGFGSMTVKLTLSAWDKRVIAETIFNMLSRGFCTCCWSAISVSTNETYPTIIRGLGYGAANAVGRVGAMLAPFILNFEDNPILALAVIGGSLLASAFAVIFLAETSGKAMTDAIVIGQASNKKMEMKVHETSNRAAKTSIADNRRLSCDFSEQDVNDTKVWPVTFVDDKRAYDNPLPKYDELQVGVENTRL